RLVTRSFECGDGEYLGIHTGAVGAFGRAMEVLGVADRVRPSVDGMDMGVPLTDEELPVIRDELVEILRTRPRAEWVQLFRDADSRPLLDGVRIVDLGAYYAGPYSSRLLADLGADVVKVEPLLGDQLRGIERPFFSAQAGKRSLAADLKHPAARPALDRLLRD